MKHGIFLGFAMIVASCARAQTPVPSLEEAAKRVEFFDINQFLYNRPGPLLWQGKNLVSSQSSQKALSEAINANRPRAELEGELHNPDPRVRTLALAALFARENPQDLPQIVALADDYATTFPGHSEASLALSPLASAAPAFQNQTVHDVVEKMADFYLLRAGFGRGFKESGVVNFKLMSNFEIYWQERRNRPFCASWFAVKLARASEGTLPTQAENVNAIRRVRAAIEALPRNDRNWTLLYLQGDEGSGALASRNELEEAAREVVAAHRDDLRQNRSVSSDPDIRPSNGERWQNMMRFLVRFGLPSENPAIQRSR